jgi:hypothetical protein
MFQNLAVLALFADSGVPVIDFKNEVWPILQKRCHSCHGPEKQKGGLRLDLASGVFGPSDSHPANVTPGDPHQSPLLRYISGEDSDLRMPPKGDLLSAEEVNRIRLWIEQGAAWREGEPAATAVGSPKTDKREWWSYQPLSSLGSLETVDQHVHAALASKGLSPAPEADRRTLIRRLHLVVHGLPPSYAEVESFVNDPAPDAFERRVDDVLASPHYGEKWAQYWLDLIGWGETHGFEINTPRPDAWPYRDYVIEAFNRNIPYPRFVAEQLAGDLLGEDRATGFLMAKPALLPGQIGRDPESKARARQDELHDMVSTTGGAFLGITLQCARCHDHKTEPVSQADYYGIQAVFSAVKNGSRRLYPEGQEPWLAEFSALQQRLSEATFEAALREPVAQECTAISPLRDPLALDRNLEHFQPVTTGRIRWSCKATQNPSTPLQLDEIEIFSIDGVNVASVSQGTRISASHVSLSERLRDHRYGEGRGWQAEPKKPAWVEFEFSRPQRITALCWSRARLRDGDPKQMRGGMPAEYQIEAQDEKGNWHVVASHVDRKISDTIQWIPHREPDAEMRRLELAVGDFLLARETTYSGALGAPEIIHRLHRGDVNQPREEAPPGTLRTIGSHPPAPLKEPGEAQRRKALAEWIASPQHPLTARVMANRIWQKVFGDGLVLTPNDFGHLGSGVSNPALLDWLAREFIRSGWRVKALERQLLLSATFRQSSLPQRRALEIDADNHLLWRFSPRRLDAECIRDGILRASGALDLTMGGPGFLVFKPDTGYVRRYDPRESFGPEHWRRMIYMTRIRVAQDGTFGAFDFPDGTQDMPRRPRSTTAIQALNLFNSPFILEQCSLFQKRIENGTPPNLDPLQAIFRIVFQRDPSPEEVSTCGPFLQKEGAAPLFRALTNSNEFLFLR